MRAKYFNFELKKKTQKIITYMERMELDAQGKLYNVAKYNLH